MAGGLSVVAGGLRATLERIHQRTALETMEFALDAGGMATAIGDGDVLHVQTVSPRFSNAVTLRGNVANPGRFTWHSGMRLRDMIPDKESLVNLVISAGAPPDNVILMPGFAGKTADEAKKWAIDKGVSLSVSAEASAGIPQGTVVRQNPAADSDVTVSKTASIVVASGAEAAPGAAQRHV